MLMKMRSQMQRTNNQKGFTLVELMVVVVIIGILIAIAIPIYNAVTARAETGAIEANLRTLDGAITNIMASENEPAGGWTATNLGTSIGNYVQGGLSQTPGTYTIISHGGGFKAQVTISDGKGPGNGDWIISAGALANP